MLQSTPNFGDDKEKDLLRSEILYSLRKQGFQIKGKKILPLNIKDKDAIRKLHAVAVEHKRANAKKRMHRFEPLLLKNIASGMQVDPQKVRPYLVEVKPKSEDELLFRYICLHWSIPVSSGYGRRLRFIIRDHQNDKAIGIIGLGDPVFALKARDNWVGWNTLDRKERLRHVMDAFVLGSVPPYSFLLCGKLIAMLVASNEVRDAFLNKYISKQSLISKRENDPKLAMITTASALGKSSIYRKIKLANQNIFHSCGFTTGSGDFHFANGTYLKLSNFVKERCKPTAKKKSWGNGFRSRREVVRKGLKELGLSADWIYHGIQRELFVVPLAKNTKLFLQRKEKELIPMDLPTEKISNWFRKRWLIPRSERNTEWVEFIPDKWRLWESIND